MHGQKKLHLPSKYHPIPSCINYQKCIMITYAVDSCFTILNDGPRIPSASILSKTWRKGGTNQTDCLISQTDSNRPEKKRQSWGVHCPPTLQVQRDTDAQFCTPPTSKQYPVWQLPLVCVIKLYFKLRNQTLWYCLMLVHI